MDQDRTTSRWWLFRTESVNEFGPLSQLPDCLRYGDASTLEFNRHGAQVGVTVEEKDDKVAPLTFPPMRGKGEVCVDDDPVGRHISQENFGNYK